MQQICNQNETRKALLDAYLDRVKHLPPAPTLMIQLIELFRQPDADPDEIVTLLRRDPALSVEVLRRCNSAFYGNETPVVDINEAVFRLGFYEVYQITVALSGMRMMTVKDTAAAFPAEELRRHSSIAAIAAGALAMDADVSEGMAFTAGLLHDVGKLALGLGEGEKYATLMHECERKGDSLSAVEKERFGFNHGEIGARLLCRWSVPDELVLPVLGHNDAGPGTEESQFLVLITNLSSRLAHYLQREKPGVPFIELPGVNPLVDILGLENSRIVEWEHSVREQVKNLPANLAV